LESKGRGQAGIVSELSDDVSHQLDKRVEFESPFEKLYIYLSLLRKERPLVEPPLFNYKNLLDVTAQLTKNKAMD
jgi:hypothetical protein